MAETTQPASPSSSQPASPSAPAAVSAPATTPAPSSPTTAAPAAQPSAPAARPGYIPETHWDPQAGKVKDEKALADWVNGNAAAVAAEASRKLTLPAKPEAYEFKTSPNFKPPEGVNFSLDPANPVVPQVQAWAHKHGISQGALSEVADLYAASMIGDQQSLKAAYTAEVAKLGAAGTQRVDAVVQWLNAVGGPKAATLANMFKLAPVADTIEAVEHMMKLFQTQGGASFSPQHREQAPERPSAEQWSKMSFSERMDFARQHKQPTGTQ